MLGLIDTNPISRWKHGKNIPNIKTLFKLAQIYHVFPHEIYPNVWEESMSEEDLFALQEHHINQLPTDMDT